MGDNKNVNLRLASVEDASALSVLYKPFAEDTAVSFEYVAPDKDEWEEKIREKTQVYPFIIAEVEGVVAGYAYASPFINRPAYCHSVEVTLYISQNYWGIGIGRKLYTALEALLRLQNVLSANACIAVPDAPDERLNNNSMLFHAKMGYRYVGYFNASGYKFDRFYNMIWMEKLLFEPKAPFPDFVPFAKIADRAEEILSSLCL